MEAVYQLNTWQKHETLGVLQAINILKQKVKGQYHKVLAVRLRVPSEHTNHERNDVDSSNVQCCKVVHSDVQ